ELYPEVPEGLVAIVERLMRKAPEARFASAQEVVEALQRFAAPRSWTGGTARPSARRNEPVQDRIPTVSSTQADTPPPAPRRAPEAVTRPAAATAHPSLLPNRQSLRHAAPEEPDLLGESDSFTAPPGFVDSQPRGLIERIGAVGIAIGALVACA